MLNFADTYNDLLFITKRLGRVAAACLPALLFLTLRPSPLPRTLYLSLLPIHKWLSRIVVLESLIHTVMYMVYYQRIGTLKKVLKFENLLGYVALAAFVLIGITSLPKIRRAAFKTFYITHYIMTWGSVIALHIHARPGIGLYTIFNVSLLAWQIAYRIWKTSKTKISVVPISPTLALVEFPTSIMKKKTNLPGGHVRINNKHGFIKNLFYQIIPLAHPFTIASLPNDQTTKLIVRRGHFPLKSNKEYYVTGVFEPELNFISEPTILHKLFGPRLRQRPPIFLSSPSKYDIDAQRVMIVVGGSGISFGIPLMRILNYNGIGTRLIWVCKDIKDLNLLNHFPGIQGIECYITGDVNKDDIVIDYYEDKSQENIVQRVANYGAIEDSDEIDFTTLGRSYKEAHSAPSQSRLRSFRDNENVNIDISGTCQYRDEPLSTQSNVILTSPEEIDAEAFKSVKIPKSVNIFYGRPNLGSEHYNWCLQSQCVGPAVSRNGESVCCRDIESQHQVDRSKVWIVAAGPTGLVDHAKQWATDGGLQCHVESFAV